MAVFASRDGSEDDARVRIGLVAKPNFSWIDPVWARRYAHPAETAGLGDPMLEHDTYRQLATLNGLIVETRELVRRQKALVLALADLPEGEDAVLPLRGLQGSLRELTYRRNMLVRKLVKSQFWRLTDGTVGHLHAGIQPAPVCHGASSRSS